MHRARRYPAATDLPWLSRCFVSASTARARQKHGGPTAKLSPAGVRTQEAGVVGLQANCHGHNGGGFAADLLAVFCILWVATEIGGDSYSGAECTRRRQKTCGLINLRLRRGCRCRLFGWPFRSIRLNSGGRATWQPPAGDGGFGGYITASWPPASCGWVPLAGMRARKTFVTFHNQHHLFCDSLSRPLRLAGFRRWVVLIAARA